MVILNNLKWIKKKVMSLVDVSCNSHFISWAKTKVGSMGNGKNQYPRQVAGQRGEIRGSRKYSNK